MLQVFVGQTSNATVIPISALVKRGESIGDEIAVSFERAMRGCDLPTGQEKYFLCQYILIKTSITSFN